MQDYQTIYDEFRWPSYENFNFARDVFDKWAQDPEKLALWWIDDAGNEVKKTFFELQQDSCRICCALAQQGLQKGDVIIVMLPRLVEWWAINIACLRMGLVISPGTAQLTSKDIHYRCNIAEAKAIITDMSHQQKIDTVIEQCPTIKKKFLVDGDCSGWLNFSHLVAQQSPEFATVENSSNDPAILYFTSGTTGYPKMTLHTHVSYPLAHMTTGKYWLDLKPEDLHWNLSDTGWAKAAWSSLFGPWNMGAAIFVHHSERFSPAKTLEIFAKYPITTLCAAPTHYRMFVQLDLQQYSFSSLRHCVSAGEPLNPEVIQEWKKVTDLIIRDGYGQTETVLLVGNFPGMEPRYGSMGKPAPGFDVQIIDQQGNIVATGQEGDIAVKVTPERPLGLFQEYWKNPEKTQQCYVGDWYITGDRGYCDEDGYLWFVGRADDVINSAGYRIGPFEVESALLEHPAVAESAVVASPDKMRDCVVKAFIILAPGYQGSEELIKDIQDHVKKHTAPYKYPRKIEFVDSLPKTVSGKIRRIELREREWNQNKQ